MTEEQQPIKFKLSDLRYSLPSPCVLTMRDVVLIAYHFATYVDDFDPKRPILDQINEAYATSVGAK